MPSRAQHILYLTTDSLAGGLGQSQIWSYLSRLARPERQFTVISWEPPRGEQPAWRASAEARLAREAQRLGIHWVPLRRTAWLGRVGIVWDGLRTLVLALGKVLAKRVSIVHARSDVAMAIGWVVHGLTRCRTIYDMRGFWADERLDGGLWREGALYRLVRSLEERWVRKADTVVVLTDAAATRLTKRVPTAKIDVIPTAVDLEQFVPLATPVHLEVGGWMVIYSGSLGTWQGLDDIGAFFRAVCRRRPGSHLVILTPELPERWYARLLGDDLHPGQVVAEVDPAPVTLARRIASADVGVALYRRTRSAAGCSPVKVGEYLACGIPVVVSAGIGDCDGLLPRWRVGVVAPPNAWDDVVEALEVLRQDPQLPARCRALAEEQFSIDRVSARYHRLYAELDGREARVSPGTARYGAFPLTEMAVVRSKHEKAD